MTRRHYEQKHGFTLLELLVSVSVTVLIVVLIFQCFSITEQAWRRSEQRADTFRNARAALDVIARDLKGLVLLPRPPVQPGAPPVAVGSTDLVQPSLVLAHSADTPQAERAFNDELYALVSAPNSGKSSLCAVGYYASWSETTRTYSLKRVFKNSDATFAAFRQSIISGQALPSFADLYFGPKATTDTLAGCVWDLRFRPSEGGKPSEAFPEKTYAEALPRWIEVRFKAAPPSAMSKLQNMQTDRSLWTNTEATLYKKLVLPYVQQFSIRVKLEAGTE